MRMQRILLFTLLSALFAGGLTTPAAAQTGTPGKITLLHFWATWCGPCVMELPELDKLAADYAGKNISILTISEDSDGAAAVDKFLAEHPTIQHLRVMYDSNQAAGKKLGVSGIPVTIVIGPDGKEIRRFTGATEWNAPSIRHELDQLMAGK